MVYSYTDILDLYFPSQICFNLNHQKGVQKINAGLLEDMYEFLVFTNHLVLGVRACLGVQKINSKI